MTEDQQPQTTEERDRAARSHGNPTVVSDPASELVDTDPAHDTPASPSDHAEKMTVSDIVYVYAGANAGGQALYLCTTCGALLQEDSQMTHTDWHVKGNH